jgi:carboxypeptidase Q
MLRRVAVVAGAFTCLATAAAPPSDGAIARQIAASILDGGQVSRDVTALTAAAGPRLTGSATYAEAVDWSLHQFRAIGISRVALEPFSIDRAWQRVSASARIVSPGEQRLHVVSLGWMPSTPDGGLEAEVVAVPSLATGAIEAQSSLKGRIALLPDGEPYGTPYGASRTRRTVDARLRDAGAVAMLSPDTDPGNELSARWRGFDTTVGALPAAQIGRDDALAIRHLLDRGSVRIAIDLRNQISPATVTVSNVIAELRGREKPDEWVLVGAHLDSWDFATGAQDNATGVAQVIAAARAIAAAGRAPRRSIRFVLFGGEEQGQIGSAAYVRAHERELDGCVAMLNTDAGTGRTIGWTTPGRGDVARGARALAGDALDALGAGTFDEGLQYAFQSDGAHFLLAGIPLLDLNADDSAYEEIHHKITDTADRVDSRNLAVSAAAVAVTAWAIADAPKRIAPRLARRAVARSLVSKP